MRQNKGWAQRAALIAGSAMLLHLSAFAEDRVAEARLRVETDVRGKFASQGVKYPARVLLLRAFKSEGIVEVWAGDGGASTLRLIETVPVCAQSGDLGPKRRQGDGQVPEGFYVVNRYNPKSSFHLSLGLNYPNRADRIAGKKLKIASLGGDIFIHGDCVTIGCLPLTDARIEAVYLAAWDAKRVHGAKTYAHIFPFRLSEAAYADAVKVRPELKAHVPFWRTLQAGQDAFDRTQRIPKVTVSSDGAYHVAAARPAQ